MRCPFGCFGGRKHKSVVCFEKRIKRFKLSTLFKQRLNFIVLTANVIFEFLEERH